MARGRAGGGARLPKFLSQVLAKIAICSAAYPILGLRQLPSASVVFRHIYMGVDPTRNNIPEVHYDERSWKIGTLIATLKGT